MEGSDLEGTEFCGIREKRVKCPNFTFKGKTSAVIH
jgi:hypothetical protein